MGDDPELACWMMNHGDGFAFSCSYVPATAKEVDLVIGVAAAVEVDRQMQVQEAGVGGGTQYVAFIERGLGPCVVGRESCSSANREILTLQFMVEKTLGRAVIGDLLESEERDHAFLEGAKAAFNFSFCLRTRSDQMRDAKRRESPLKLGAWIPPVGRGLVTEEG